MQRTVDKMGMDDVLRAGVHTFEIVTRDCNLKKLPSYVNEAYRRKGDALCVVEINPHKANEVDGLRQCVYGSASKVQAVIERAAKEMQWADDWHFSRVDFCFDCSLPFEETEKLTRLLIMLMATSKDWTNHYFSNDLLNLGGKTTRVDDKYARKPYFDYQIDHYNRSYIDQSDYDTQIINRLEFRMAGKAIADCDGRRNVRKIVDKWLQIMREAIEPGTLATMETKHAAALYSQWQANQMRGSGLDKKRIKQFIRAHDNHIFTRGEVAALFKLDVPEAAPKKIKEKMDDLLKSFAVELFTTVDLIDFCDLLKIVAEEYFRG